MFRFLDSVAYFLGKLCQVTPRRKFKDIILSNKYRLYLEKIKVTLEQATKAQKGERVKV
jgi:hypothetical protein